MLDNAGTVLAALRNDDGSALFALGKQIERDIEKARKELAELERVSPSDS